MNISKYLFVTLLALFSWNSFGQISEGYIRYERRTNIFKKYNDPMVQKFLGEKNKYKYDHFITYFNADSSVYIPDETDPEPEGMLKWLMLRHSAIQNFKTNQNVTLLNIFGQIVVVKDTLRQRNWKYTGKIREIAGYKCDQVLLNVNDSTRLYAWFTTDIIPQVGPENFFGLPGAILGVAAEDGRMTYFAKEVVATKVDFDKITPKYKDKDAMDWEKTKDKMVNEFGKRKEAKPIIDEILTWQYF